MQKTHITVFPLQALAHSFPPDLEGSLSPALQEQSCCSGAALYRFWPSADRLEEVQLALGAAFPTSYASLVCSGILTRLCRTSGHISKARLRWSVKGCQQARRRGS